MINCKLKLDLASRLAVKIALYQSITNESQRNCISAEWTQAPNTPGIQKSPDGAFTITKRDGTRPRHPLVSPSLDRKRNEDYRNTD